MIQQIKVFLFVLSLIYLIRFVIEFGIKLTQDEPEPMTLTKVEKISQLLASSYIITYFLI